MIVCGGGAPFMANGSRQVSAEARAAIGGMKDTQAGDKEKAGSPY